MMRARWSVPLGVALLLFTSPALAESEPEPGPPRPVSTAAIELNPLATLLSGRFGGQMQLGLVDSFTLVGGISRVDIAGTQQYSNYDETTWGLPARRGWSFELGTRMFVRLGRPRKRAHYFWVGAALLYERLTQEEVTRGERGAREKLVPLTDVVRYGAAVEAGFHIALGGGFYLLLGLGLAFRVSDPALFHRDASGSAASFLSELAPSYMDRNPITPRLLLSPGWSF